MAGVASYASSKFSVTGAGWDIGGKSDSFRYVYKSLSGDVFLFYNSTDGINWTRIAKSTVTMNNTILVGLAVTSRGLTVHNTSTFDHVSVKITAAAAASYTPQAVALAQSVRASAADGIFSDEKIKDDVLT